MRWLLLAVLTSTGCATLDTAGMTPACRDSYNACLSGCPTPPPPGNNGIVDASPDLVTPSCVQSCNQQAKRCG